LNGAGQGGQGRRSISESGGFSVMPRD
jgi:hypothetical protein